MQQTLDVSRKPSHRGRTLLILIALVALGIAALIAFRVGGEPTIEISPKLPGIGARTPVAVTVEEPRRGVKRVTVQLVQGDRVETLADESYPTRPAWAFWGRMQPQVQLAEEVGSETVSGLAEGEATLRVTAERASTWLRRPAPAVRELTLPVRLRPPTLGLVSSQHNAVQGGSGVVVYRVGEGAVESGVAVGERWFPGYPLPGAIQPSASPSTPSPMTSTTPRRCASPSPTRWATGDAPRSSTSSPPSPTPTARSTSTRSSSTARCRRSSATPPASPPGRRRSTPTSPSTASCGR